MSWFNPREDMFIMRILVDITEPILSPLRRIVPRLGMLDITPLVAILLLSAAERLLESVILNAFR